jgi:hypothetical protein
MWRSRTSPLAAVLLVACATAEYRPAPDAGHKACGGEAVAFCAHLDAGAVGCSADPGAGAATVRKLPAGAYSVGCEANLVGPDENGECRLITSCTCTAPAADAGAGPYWRCD